MGGPVTGGYVDLHTHTCYSDGTMTPAEVLEAARRQGVSLLAVTDHDVLGGARALQALGARGNITCISGVELDAVELGINFHILGYGMDLQNAAFAAFCRENRARLEEVNRTLITKMERAGEPVSLAEYDAYTYDPRGGGWTALHYFLEKGLSTTLTGGLALYGRYRHTYACVSFPGIAQVAERIHAAGGLAVLAHPGEVIPTADMAGFRQTVLDVMTLELDGIECHYAFHSQAVTNLCLALCAQYGWLVTCGSDCHGDFGHSRVGQLPVPQAALSGLDRILAAQENTLRAARYTI